MISRQSHGRALVGLFTCSVIVCGTLLPRSASAQFLGEIRWVGFNFAPQGWAFCNGQLLAISQNTALFTLLGTTYGGDGESTFALPDMRGRFPLHPGQGPGLTNHDLGEEGGVEVVTLTTAEMPSHSHTLASHTHSIPALAVDVKASSADATATTASGNVLATATGGNGGRGQGQGANPPNIYNAGPADVSMAAGIATTAAGTTGGGSGATMATGGSTPHQNMPPFLGVNCIINIDGVFPPGP